MGKLIYSAICSLDGYVEDTDGSFDWAAPDEEVHTFVNDLQRPVGTYLYGRRMYETMVYWETVDTTDDESASRDYAQIWRAADKVVYSRTLESATSARTTVERDFDPDAVRALMQSSPADLGIGGAQIAGEALAAGLVEEIQLIVSPVLVGGGKSALPGGLRLRLVLLDEHRFGDGVVYLRYRVHA